jgi:hypothetical protein
MKHKDAIGSMYFVCGYAAAIALIWEGEHVYHKLLAACMTFYFTWHIIDSYEN